MKKTTAIILALIIWSSAAAQGPWQIEGYTYQTTVSVDTVNKIVTIERVASGNTLSNQYALHKMQGKWTFADKASAAMMMKDLQLDEMRINNRYSEFGQEFSAAEKLIKRALQLPGGVIQIEGTSTLGSHEEDGALENNTPSAADKNTNLLSVAIWWLPLALVAGLLLGWLLPFRKKRITHEEVKPNTVEPTSSLMVEEDTPKKAAPSKLEKITDLRAQIKALVASEKSLKTDLQMAHATLNEQQLFNDTYYPAAFTKLVQPAQEALDKRDKKAVIELMVKMSAQYASLIRAMLKRKLGHDEANLRYLAKGTIETTTPIVDAQTPNDDIPNNIQVLVELLKEQGSQGIDDTIVSGYKIQNI